MRLSEAIRLGSLLEPDPRAAIIEHCALGMAGKAVGLDMHVYSDTETVIQALLAKWPWLSTANYQCPRCSISLYSLKLVWHVFDSHVMAVNPGILQGDGSMTIDQLADWIASIEPQEEIQLQTTQRGSEWQHTSNVTCAANRH